MSTINGMWTYAGFVMMKGQDILFLFKISSFQAQEVLTPTGHSTMVWGGLSQLDFGPESYASLQMLTVAPTAEEPPLT
ncbi:hypothetical protein [Pseudomonas taiwanensis]|uniref:Uncharacterized protein n=1 Tax=Pseudomonas taiwanensis TaxID=470150 RepID=A0ABR6V5J4_9PSED|nr:hypothetical protein [Pseudomonas taiwanensis]MBC3475770.1 hypothetical protein [Pseudomonas taiwanensis]